MSTFIAVGKAVREIRRKKPSSRPAFLGYSRSSELTWIGWVPMTFYGRSNHGPILYR